MNELLALLGLAWPRLLLYPGGVCALLLAWLWWRTVENREPRTENREPQASSVIGHPSSVFGLTTVPPLLLISLLPLPFGVQLGRSIDLLVAVALLEWPMVVTLTADDPAGRERRIERLKLGYGALLPALLLLAQGSRSFALDALVARPGQIELLPLVLRMGAIGGWALALVPLLELGPFQDDPIQLLKKGKPASSMRAVGHMLVATLPLLALLGDWQWLAPLPPLALGAMLIAAHRRTSANVRVWMLALRAMTALLWALLAWAGFAALLARAS